MSVDLETVTSSGIEEYQHYREMSWTAVASCAFGILSLGAISLAEAVPWYLLTLVACAAVGSGLAGLSGIKRYDLGGRRAALAGVCFGFAGLSLGLGTKGYIYATEVPEGFERLTYSQLEGGPGQTVNPKSKDWNGKKVFIKGYIYPGSQTKGIRTLLLCRDKGDCCFGGSPKISDMVQVKLKNGLSIDFDTQLHAVAGTFHVEDGYADRGDKQTRVVFHLDGEYYH